MKDTYWHKGMRKKLVEQLKKRGIKDENVLKAINALPRHFFMEKAFEEQAYEDSAFPIGNEQTISQPYTVAFQTELLSVKKGDEILEIGTGSGYQAAILALLGAKVYTLERQELLFQRARKLLQSLGIYQVKCFFHDGNNGLPKNAPFDKIILTAGSEELPTQLIEQLKVGGIMVAPIGSETQQMYRVLKTDNSKFTTDVHGVFKFVPFKKGVKKLKE